MDFFNLFKQNTKPTRFNSDNRVSNMYDTKTINGQQVRVRPKGRTLKQRDLSNRQMQSFNPVGFLDNIPFISDTRLNEKYGLPQNTTNLLGILGGPLALGFARAKTELDKIRSNTQQIGGGNSTGGVRTGGGNYFDLILDILKRQGIIK